MRPHEKHGKSKTGTYKIWTQMIQRCTNPKTPYFELYGGRGIKVCDRWKFSFVNFLADMKEQPGENMSLDRHPNQNGNYEPGNVRWATATEQQRNIRWNIRIEHNGRTQLIYDWATEAGIPVEALRTRRKRGWSVERMLTEPLEPHQGTRNLPVTHNGKTQTVSEWAKELGINYYTLASRVKRGWSALEAIRGTRDGSTPDSAIQ